MKHIRIAIDGPAGAGKSTLARRAAQTFGFLYVDTGAIYRTAALHMLETGVDPADGPAVSAALDGLDIRLAYGPDGIQHMYRNGEDVTDRIRTPEVSRAASQIAAYPAVRAFLLETQRSLAREHSVVMDGRDIGTVVLPDADVKIFLTASPEERARRRTRELAEKGTPQPYAAVLREMEQRDADDANRAAAPLRRAADALELDTSALSLDESAAALEKLIRERTG